MIYSYFEFYCNMRIEICLILCCLLFAAKAQNDQRLANMSKNDLINLIKVLMDSENVPDSSSSTNSTTTELTNSVNTTESTTSEAPTGGPVVLFDNSSLDPAVKADLVNSILKLIYSKLVTLETTSAASTSTSASGSSTTSAPAVTKTQSNNQLIISVPCSILKSIISDKSSTTTTVAPCIMEEISNSCESDEDLAYIPYGNYVQIPYKNYVQIPQDDC